MNSFRAHTAGLLAALGLQYALGMYVNLFVAFPDGLNEEQMWQFSLTQWPLVSHILLAVGLFVGAVALCVRAAMSRDKHWIWASMIGLVSILAAGVSGSQFVSAEVE